MTENDEKKEYLKNYKKSCDKLKSLEDQMETLRQAEQSAKVQNISDMPKGSKQSDLSDYIVKLEELMIKIIQLRSECMKQLVNIEERISLMSNGIESIILHKRYIEFKAWEQICVEMDYSWRQIHYLHSRALNDFNIA